MTSLFAMLDARETDVRAHVEELRGQIDKLAEQLAAAEGELTRLAITRTTALSVGWEEQPGPEPDPVIAQPAYRQILAEFERTDVGLRAGQLCQILDAGTEPKHREGMRARLKRLATRGILTETEPGLFVLVANTTRRQQP